MITTLLANSNSSCHKSNSSTNLYRRYMVQFSELEYYFADSLDYRQIWPLICWALFHVQPSFSRISCAVVLKLIN